jgi:signal transduction histidine kinase
MAFGLILTSAHARADEATDADFRALLEKGRNYAVTYPYHTDSALMILLPLLHGQEGEDKELNRGRVLNAIGMAYDTRGQYDSTAHYLYESLRIAEKLEDDSLQISVFSNLGILQYALKNPDEAIGYYHRSLAIAERINYSMAVAKMLNNIGNAYMTLSLDFEKATPYFERCMAICDSIGYREGYRTAGSNLVQIYSERGELDKALRECNRLIAQYGYDRYLGYMLGVIHFKKGDYRQAIRTYKSLLVVPLNSRELEIVILGSIAEAYKASNRLDSTVTYLEKTHALKDSLHNRQTAETIQNLKIGYETEKKETQIATLEDRNRLVTRLGIATGAALLLAVVAFAFLWRWMVQKKRLVENQKALAEQQIKQLEQEKQLIATQAVLDGEVQERTRLARDLHDGLGSMLTGLKMKLVGLKNDVGNGNTDAASFDGALGILDDSMNEMRRVAHHLMPDALSRFGLKSAVSDFCDTLPAVKFAWYGSEERLDPKPETALYRIIHELIHNAVKHSGASQILVQIAQETDRIALTVQDNGCGFDPAKVTAGMGLANIRTRVASFGGNLFVDTTPGAGTEINVELRIKNDEKP